MAQVPDCEGIPVLMDNDLARRNGERSVVLLLQVMFSQKHPVSSATAARPQEKNKAFQKQVVSNTMFKILRLFLRLT